MRIVAGVDIGGTKCAVLVGREENGCLEVLEKERSGTVCLLGGYSREEEKFRPYDFF